MTYKLTVPILIVILFITFACEQKKTQNESSVTEIISEPSNWAERLGYPPGKKVIMLHADDAGMCEEANIAIEKYLTDGDIQSTAAMPPCPNFEEIIAWAIDHPDIDLGLHLTLTSEWETYRWPSVLPATEIPGLIDEDGMLWHEVPDVVQHASPEEVRKEIRAQIDKTIALGYRPNHIDTHMGTLYGSPEYAKVFLQTAMEYGIPANAIDMSDSLVVAYFREAGYPLTDEIIEFMEAYTLPKLDNFTSAPNTKTYEEKVAAFQELIKSLRPGITEIIFHPSVETENLKGITHSWQQRVWEAKMFADPEMKKFFEEEGIIFTNWKEIMERFNESKP